MNWLEIHIDTNHAGLEPVEAMLSSLDVDGVVIEGASSLNTAALTASTGTMWTRTSPAAWRDCPG